MTLFLFIKQAFSSILSNKLRSFLSLLGIMIGISSFVIMLSIWEGAKQSIMKSMQSSANLITVSSSGNPWTQGTFFSEVLATKIQEKVTGIGKVLATYSQPSGRSDFNGKEIRWQIQPVSIDYLPYKKLEMQYGSYFSQSDFKKREKFVILWSAFIKKSDGYAGFTTGLEGTIPIWQTINIAGESFLIIGVLKEKSWEDNQALFIPSTTYKKIFNNASISGYQVFVEDENTIEQTKNLLQYFLYKTSGKEKKELPFTVRTNKESMKQVNEMSQKFTLLLGGIGAIALIVGGIGIMNIMVVSVTERTREIGIRKAIGATNKNILFQFLVESVILTLFWSAIAVAFSQWAVVLVGKLMPDFTPVINSYVLMIAITVSVAMGIIFGLMPAYKAAKLKIIDALHFE